MKRLSTLVACARWETSHIAEWLEYHRLIGFEHVHLYCNDDAPDELYDAARGFVESGFVTFQFWPERGAQKRMYLDYLTRHKDETEWLMFLDIDEFLRLPKHGSVPAFLADLGADADGIYLNWSSFGNNGYEERPEGSVLLNYTRRAEVVVNGSCKGMTRAAAISLEKLGLGPRSDFWHYWDSLTNFRDLRFINVLGKPVHDYNDNPEKWHAYLNDPEIAARLHETAIVNHYAYKAYSDFLRRAERGADGDFRGQAANRATYEKGEGRVMLWVMNQVEDLYLHDLWAKYKGKQALLF